MKRYEMKVNRLENENAIVINNHVRSRLMKRETWVKCFNSIRTARISKRQHVGKHTHTQQVDTTSTTWSDICASDLCSHGKNIYFYHVHHLIFISFYFVYYFDIVLSGPVHPSYFIRAQFEIGFIFSWCTRRLKKKKQINKSYYNDTIIVSTLALQMLVACSVCYYCIVDILNK